MTDDDGTVYLVELFGTAHNGMENYNILMCDDPQRAPSGFIVKRRLDGSVDPQSFAVDPDDGERRAMAERIGRRFLGLPLE